MRWPSSCEDLNLGVEECPFLSSLRAGVVRSMKVVAEVGEGLETRKEVNVVCWKPLPSHG